jgi:hypothetical protein
MIAMIQRTFLFLSALVCFATTASVVLAEDYTSSSFIIRDPVMSIFGGYSSSTSFGHVTGDGQTVIGEQASGSFTGRSGALYFPIVTSPSVSATAGTEEVALTWTASVADLGWNVSGYQIGQATVSGGPYAYTSVGNVLASTRTGLNAGTTYYFIIRTLDAFGNVIAQSGEVSAVPTAASGGDDDDGGGGGGSGVHPTGGSIGRVILEGYAHPGGIVSVLRDGVLVQEINVGSDGRFSAILNETPLGTHVLTFYGVDATGTRSGLLSFQVLLTSLSRTTALQLFIPPTLSVEEGSAGQLEVSGSTVPGASVGVIITNGDTTISLLTGVADENGNYLLSVSRSLLQSSSIAFRALAAVNTVRSPFGLAVRVPISSVKIALRGDFNNDGRVNLIDFSMLAYWHERANPPAAIDLNGDGKVSLVDFSILTYYWTG